MCIRDRVSFTRMQLNVNAEVFESAVAWYAARTGPAAATTSAAGPSSTARERSHLPGDIPGPPPAGTGVWREVRLTAEEASGCSLAAGHSPGLIARTVLRGPSAAQPRPPVLYTSPS